MIKKREVRSQRIQLINFHWHTSCMKTKSRIRFCAVIVIGLASILNNSCDRLFKDNLPTVYTTGVFNLQPASVSFSGKITSTGGSGLTEQGFCYSTGHFPVITDNKIRAGFRCRCPYTLMTTGLNPQTDYYVRAYATNDIGTAYGEEVPFTTPADHSGETGTVEDADGNVYKTIGIGSQVWMAENLKATRYSNGDPIGTTTPATLDISNDFSHKYQWAYGGDESNAAVYGRLYTWYAATDTRNVCPAGWHVFSDEDWSTLIIYLGSADSAGGKLKETGTTHWQSPNAGATNETGFSALPGGGRDGNGRFFSIGSGGFWWSSSEISTELGSYRSINFDYSNVFIYNIEKHYGFSVRCLQD